MVEAFYSPESTQMLAFPQQIQTIAADCPDPTLLGTFVECHDVPRMAYYTQDLALLKTVNTWNILFDGIPVIYQGQEQRFDGNSDPYNREAVWLSGYPQNATLYVLIKFLNRTHPKSLLFWFGG
jgi:alpha-amylase